MKFSELALSRFSVRSYRKAPVPKQLILEILESGRIAPSAVNYQPWCFVIVNEDDRKKALQEAYPREWFKQAPVYIVVCADRGQAWMRNRDQKNFADVDAAIAADHIILQATELGLGSCWVCNFDVEKCKAALNIPDFTEPLVIIPIGYSDEVPKAKIRKPLEDIVRWNKF